MRLNRLHFRLLAGIAIALGAATCVASFPARESRLSGAVALVARSPEVQSFLRNPGTGYVQGFVRFGADMPDDVIMFVDQAWLEGVDQPDGTMAHPGYNWTAMGAINAIPDVCDAAPGWLTHLDLGMIRPRGLVRK